VFERTLKPPPHHRADTTPLPITTAGHPITPITLISPFYHKPILSQISFFFFVCTFCSFTGTHPLTDCAPLLLCWIFDCLKGVGDELGRGFETLVVKVAHQVFGKKP
jgi:hypothetical protein